VGIAVGRGDGCRVFPTRHKPRSRDCTAREQRQEPATARGPFGPANAFATPAREAWRGGVLHSVAGERWAYRS
jgi:hypothetical protein